MKTTILILFVSFFIAFNGLAQKQNSDTSFVVSGKVINPETMEGISYAHINLHETYWGIICDSLGFFHIRVHPNQQLRVSALGFKEQIVNVLPPAMEEEEVFQEIYMERESYLLEEVKIYSLGTWEQFKETFVKTDVPKEKKIAESFDFGNLSLEQAKAKSLSNGGFGLNFSSLKLFKSKRKGTGNQLTDWQLRILQTKYNKDVVAEITKESGHRLEILMAYINSKAQFTHQTSELYIGARVKQLYDDFLEDYPQLDDKFSFSDSIGTVPNHLRP